MLDALVAEARVRWGLDLAAGLQVIATEQLIATSLDPARPVMLVPLAALAPRPVEAAASGPGAGPAPDAVAPVPGRHGPRGREPLGLLRRLYPADHAVGRIGLTDGTTIGELDATDLAGALYLSPVAPEL